MAPFRRDAANQFKAKATVDLETIAAKLHTAREALAAVESEIRHKSLEAALADDPELVMSPLRERMARARADIELLETAHEVAVQAERARLAEAADAAEKARQRRIKTLGLEIAKAGEKFTKPTEEQIAIYRDLVKLGGQLYDTMTEAERHESFGTATFQAYLDRLVRLEVSRAADMQYPTAPRFVVEETVPGRDTVHEHDGSLKYVIRRGHVDYPEPAPPKFPFATLLDHADVLPFVGPGGNEQVPVRDAPKMGEMLRRRFAATDADKPVRAAPDWSVPPVEPRPPTAPAEGGGGRRPPNATIKGVEIIGDYRGIGLADPEPAADPIAEAERVLVDPDASRFDLSAAADVVRDIAEAHRVVADPESTPEAVAAAQELLSWRVPQGQ